MNLKTLYGQYKRLFQAEKKINNIKNDVRQDTYKEFVQDMADPTYGGSIKKILDQQRNVKPEERKALWKKYRKILKEEQLKPGQQTQQAGTYWGETSYGKNGLGYHRTFSGLMRDRHAQHFVIAYRIEHGEDKREVLADFGY